MTETGLPGPSSTPTQSSDRPPSPSPPQSSSSPTSTRARTDPIQESEPIAVPVAVAMSELAPSPTRDSRVEAAEIQEEAEMERIKSINQITANARLATGQHRPPNYLLYSTMGMDSTR